LEGSRKKNHLQLISLKFILRPCQHDDGYIDGRSQIKVHTDERTQVPSVRMVTIQVLTEVDIANFSERVTELALVAIVSLQLISIQKSLPTKCNINFQFTTFDRHI